MISHRNIANRPRSRPGARGGFSIVEMLIALAISAALLTATLAALDSSFKHYKSTTESASTHVVSRIMMHRMLAMIRTGEEFGPYPNDPLSSAQNPVESDFIEFVSARDEDGSIERITRIEFRRTAEQIDAGEPGDLWYVLLEPGDPGAILIDERPMLSGVRQAAFTLQFDNETWRMSRATIDITIEPNDSIDLTIGADSVPETIRLVASAAPRHTY